MRQFVPHVLPATRPAHLLPFRPLRHEAGLEGGAREARLPPLPAALLRGAVRERLPLQDPGAPGREGDAGARRNASTARYPTAHLPHQESHEHAHPGGGGGGDVRHHPAGDDDAVRGPGARALLPPDPARLQRVHRPQRQLRGRYRHLHEPRGERGRPRHGNPSDPGAVRRRGRVHQHQVHDPHL